MKLTKYLDKVWGIFAHDLAIDLGTANSLVYVRGKGIVIKEPSAVALHAATNQVLAIGQEAQRMMGKTPQSIVTIKPLREGVISDFDVAEAMLSHFIKKVHRSLRLFPPKIPRPRVVIGVPSSVTEVERKAVVDAAKRGGAREVFLIEEALAAALGAGMSVDEPHGNLVVDIGGGTTEIALISLGGIVAGRSLRLGGDELDQAIISWAKEKKGLAIGEKSAEDLKIQIGSAWVKEEGDFGDENSRSAGLAVAAASSSASHLSPQSDPPERQEADPASRLPSLTSSSTATAALRGRDLTSGLPKEIEITRDELREVILPVLMRIVLGLKEVIEEAPPELLVEVYKEGLVLTGGGSQISGMDQLIAEHTQVPVRKVEDPFVTVTMGCAKVLEDLSLLERLKLYY